MAEFECRLKNTGRGSTGRQGETGQGVPFLAFASAFTSKHNISG